MGRCRDRVATNCRLCELLILNDSRGAIKVYEIAVVNTVISLSQEIVTRGRRDGLVILTEGEFLPRRRAAWRFPSLSDILRRDWRAGVAACSLGIYDCPSVRLGRAKTEVPETGQVFVHASAARLLLRFAELRRFGQGEEHDLFAGDGADVVVQAHDLDAGDFLDHRLQERPRRFEQMGAYLFEQVSPLLGRERLDQVLFGGGQDALEADHENVVDQMARMSLGPRPMYSCSKRLIPSQMAASISPCVFMVTSRRRSITRSRAADSVCGRERPGPDRRSSWYLASIITGEKTISLLFLLSAA